MGLGPIGAPGDSLTHPESDIGDPTPPCGHNPGCGCGAPWDRDEPTGAYAIEQDPAMGHWIVWDDEGRPVYFANDKQDAQRVQNGLNDGSLNKEDLDG